MTKQYNLYERAPYVPYECIMCRDVGHGANRIIDLDVQIDFLGMIYICESCFGGVADFLGYLRPAETTIVREELALLRAKLERVPAVTERLVNDIRDLSIAATADLLSDVAPVVLVDDAVIESGNEGVNLDYFGASEPVEPGSEPAGDKGSASVPTSVSSNGATKKSARNSPAGDR